MTADWTPWAIAVVVVAAIALAIMVYPVRAHSWYPAECCSGQDCEPISEARVRAVEGGYLIDGRFFIEHARSRPAQDGRYHACFWPHPDKLHCFFRPDIGS